MPQSRRSSLVESAANVAIGYIVAVLSQMLVFPVVGIYATFSQNVISGVWFAGISLARGYLVRRFFNSRRK